MFADSFLPNLALFVAGQAAAWYYLRSGRPWFGGTAMAVLWIAADWTLVGRYAYDVRGARLWIPLATMQATAVGACAWLAFAQWRRRWSATKKQRPALFAAAQGQDLRGDRVAAVAGFRRLLRCDPWDAAAWVALGNALRSEGQEARAARCYRRAKRVDRGGEYAELCDLNLLAMRKAAKPAAAVTTERRAAAAPAAHPARS